MAEREGEGGGAAEPGSKPRDLHPDGAPSKEYYYLQDMATKFNDNCFETKKWSVALTTGVAALATLTGASAFWASLVILFLAVSFWVTEAVWRGNQFAFIRRIRKLEGSISEQGSPRISHGWSKYATGKRVVAGSWESARGETTLPGILRHACNLGTALPHGGIALVALVAAAMLCGREPPAEPEPLATYDVSVLENGAVELRKQSR